MHFLLFLWLPFLTFSFSLLLFSFLLPSSFSLFLLIFSSWPVIQLSLCLTLSSVTHLVKVSQVLVLVFLLLLPSNHYYYQPMPMRLLRPIQKLMVHHHHLANRLLQSKPLCLNHPSPPFLIWTQIVVSTSVSTYWRIFPFGSNAHQSLEVSFIRRSASTRHCHLPSY